jgi:hypothetical protein
MPITGTNNMGPYTANDGLSGEFPNYPAPVGNAVPAPTGNLVPAHSPSGAININVGRSQSATMTMLGQRPILR